MSPKVLNLKDEVLKWVTSLEKYAHRIWYFPLISALAALDLFIILIPTDGILISSTMLRPKKWFSISVWVSLGSAIGATLVGYCISIGVQGFETDSLQDAILAFEKHGLWALWLGAAGPFPVHPFVFAAVLAKMPMATIFACVFLGRWAKYLLFAYLASHAPKLLGKIWGVKGEMKDMAEAEAKVGAKRPEFPELPEFK